MAGDLPAVGGAAAGWQGAGVDGFDDEGGVAAEQGGKFSGGEGGAAPGPGEPGGGEFLEGIGRAAAKAIEVMGTGKRLGVLGDPTHEALEFREAEAGAGAGDVAGGDPSAEGLGGAAEEAGGGWWRRVG
ncbi:MAG: hypothetical protein NTX51_10070 [Verrucomicrobia bacterium]|nr:hypothetical protein [Verrucomicrobiota bacterium]